MSGAAASGTGSVTVNGAQLAYERAGSGRPVVLLHAGLADSSMWDDQVAALAATHQVIRYDLRGFGRSSLPPAPYSHRDDLHGLVRALGIERAAFIGASLGGATALDFALAYPAMTAALLLVAPGLSGYSFAAAMQARNAEIDAAGERDGVAAAVELELRLWVDGPARTPDQVPAAVRERMRALVAATYAPQPDEATRQPASPAAIERLEAITAPTLVVVGAGDVPDMLTIADLISTRIANARKIIVPAAAHMVTLEEPLVFNELALTFLQQADW